MNDITRRLRDLADEINDEPSEIDRLKAELSDRDAALMTWERVMMKAIGEDGVVSVAGAIDKLKAKIADIESWTVEKSEPVQPWPPKGVAIEVDANGNREFLPRTSAGDGFYCYPNGGLQSLKDTPWRYAPAAWDIAPEWAESWVVTESGESFWTFAHWNERERFSGGTIVHVEYRQEAG